MPTESEPNLTSVPPGARRWGLLTEEGRRLVLALDEEGGDSRFVLTVGAEHAGSERAYLDATELRALGAAARMLSGAEHQDAEAIRADERQRLAKLFEDNAATLAGFAPHSIATVNLVVLLLRLNNPTET
jgi:hypothetical protein